MHLHKEKWSWADFLVEENLQDQGFFIENKVTDVAEERAENLVLVFENVNVVHIYFDGICLEIILDNRFCFGLLLKEDSICREELHLNLTHFSLEISSSLSKFYYYLKIVK